MQNADTSERRRRYLHKISNGMLTLKSPTWRSSNKEYTQRNLQLVVPEPDHLSHLEDPSRNSCTRSSYKVCNNLTAYSHLNSLLNCFGSCHPQIKHIFRQNQTHLQLQIKHFSFICSFSTLVIRKRWNSSNSSVLLLSTGSSSLEVMTILLHIVTILAQSKR